MSFRGCLGIFLFANNLLTAASSLLFGLLVTSVAVGASDNEMVPSIVVAAATEVSSGTGGSGSAAAAAVDAFLPFSGDSSHSNSKTVTQTANFVAADIINLDRDGAVSFIPRKDIRYQRAVPPEYAGASALPHCESFTMGDPDSKTLYNPGWPNSYPNNSDCVVVLEAPIGFLVRLDFRDHFYIEQSEDCKYDYLEIRDGAHGFSTLIGKYCGQVYPPMITSKERFLWLHFHSDENIEYNGFVVVYDYVPRPTSSIYDDENCRMEVSGMEGFVNRSDVPREKLQTVIDHGLSLDCMWVVSVSDGWKIQLSFLKFKLERPNDCDSNFVDVFTERTDLPSRLKNFCGSIADSVVSRTNILHIRFYAEAAAINSTFSILFTAFREKAAGETCDDDEYDCEDATCISGDLRCNGRINCRFRWDEDECQKQTTSQSEHVIIIVIVFGLILGGMILLFLVNCIRKIIRDHKIIREHIRQSQESKLNELGRLSTKKPVDLDITKLPPPAFNKEPINLLDTGGAYYRSEIITPSIVGSTGGCIGPGTGGSVGSTSIGGLGGASADNNLFSSRIDVKGDSQDALRSSYHDDSSRFGTLRDAAMCDMACQTRESLFQPVFKNKVTQSPNQMPNSIRFSTFGYETQQQVPLVVPPPPKAKHHHHHHHHHHGGGSSIMEKGSKKSKFEMEELANVNEKPSELDNRGFVSEQRPGAHLHHHSHHPQKVVLEGEQLMDSFEATRPSGPVSYGADIRKSAPDVIIMTSSH